METITNNNITYFNITTALDIEYDSNIFIKTDTGFHINEDCNILLKLKNINFGKKPNIFIIIKREENHIAFNNLSIHFALNKSDIINFYVHENDLDRRIYETAFQILYYK